jgi:hypothetical protein
MTDEMPVSYQAAVRGTPVLSSAGTQIGTLEHVLEVPEVDVFDGIVIATKAGLRFIDADYVQRITRSHIWCSLDDAQAAQLPPPEGAPVYRVDALQDAGHSLHDVMGRLFRRPHWTREDDQGSLSQEAAQQLTVCSRRCLPLARSSARPLSPPCLSR